MHSIDKRLRIPKIVATNRCVTGDVEQTNSELGKFTVCEIKINICAKIYRTMSEIDEWVEFREEVRSSRDVCNQLHTLIFTCVAKSDAIGAYYFVEVWRDVESSARSSNATLCLVFTLGSALLLFEITLNYYWTVCQQAVSTIFFLLFYFDECQGLVVPSQKFGVCGV